MEDPFAKITMIPKKPILINYPTGAHPPSQPEKNKGNTIC